MPSLDGLRAISILLVVFSHMGLDTVVPGGLGVTVFFVVSGFLIGWQLATEAERTGRVDMRRFYLRRVFRLAPALLVYCAVSVAVLVLAGLELPGLHLAAALLYVINYVIVFAGGSMTDPFTITWSLAIEEHFYLVFPVAVMLCVRRPALLVPAGIALMAAVLAWRVALFQQCTVPGASWQACGVNPAPGVAGLTRIYYSSDTRCDAILAGVVAVCAVRFHRARLPGWLFGRATLAAAACLLVATLLVRNPAYRDTLRYTLQAVLVAAILVAAAFGPATPLTRILSARPLVYLGRLSYSLYLYHWLVAVLAITAFGTLDLHRPLLAAGVVALSLLLAAASFHLVEQPFLRWRQRFGSHAPGGLSP